MSSVPYIGAKISLISRSEIRYEGILAEVDPVESTIGLELVMMMGTEGRKAPGENIPASAQVYDFILFRSSDIKDLQVCEAAPVAPSPPPSMGFVDPAIVHHQLQPQQQQQQQQQQYSSSSSSQYQQPQQFGAWHGQPKLQFGSSNYVAPPSYNNSYGGGNLQFGSAQPYYQQQQQQQPQQPPQMYQDFAQPAPQAPSKAAQQALAPKPQPSQPQQQQSQEKQQKMPQPQPKIHPETASNIVSLTPKSDQKAGEESKVLSYSTGTKKAQLVNPPPEAPPTGKLSYASMVAGGRHEQPKKVVTAAAATSATPSRPGTFRPPMEHNKAAISAPDFSFESSQAGLQNLTSAQAEVFKAIQDKSFYSKSTSFFDDISCDAKDGKADEPRLRNERSWNVETFGVPAPPSTYSSGSNRGGSSRGGRGGRGGYRGGRGGSSSSIANKA